jgi:hypothetical protein
MYEIRGGGLLMKKKLIIYLSVAAGLIISTQAFAYATIGYKLNGGVYKEPQRTRWGTLWG